jgi:flagellar biosynthesis/type III secretory pathway protein FliH
MSTNQDLTNAQVQEIVDELLSVQYEPGSLVDRLYRQGHSEGLTKGLAEGLTKGLAEGKAEGLAKGKAEGLAKGKAEGLAKGKAEGLANGTERGIVIGRIQLLQQLLGLEVSSKDYLLQLNLPQIHDLATSLQQQLKDKST